MKIATFSKKNIISGIISGVIAGIVLGFMMMRMGVFVKIGSMMGMANPFSGFLVHLVFSAILGIIFALVFNKAIKTFFSSAVWGVVYGIIWWYLGTLTLAQMMMGLHVSWGTDAMMQGLPMLMGHLVFGLVLGISYFIFRIRK